MLCESGKSMTSNPILGFDPVFNHKSSPLEIKPLNGEWIGLQGPTQVQRQCVRTVLA